MRVWCMGGKQKAKASPEHIYVRHYLILLANMSVILRMRMSHAFID